MNQEIQGELEMLLERYIFMHCIRICNWNIETLKYVSS